MNILFESFRKRNSLFILLLVLGSMFALIQSANISSTNSTNSSKDNFTRKNSTIKIVKGNKTKKNNNSSKDNFTRKNSTIKIVKGNKTKKNNTMDSNSTIKNNSIINNSTINNSKIKNKTKNTKSNSGSDSSVFNNQCIAKFTPIISTLSVECQKEIYSIFRENKSSNSCCSAKNLAKKISNCLKGELNKFTSEMSKASINNKKSFGCYKNNEFFKAKNNINLLHKENEQDNRFLKGLLIGYNNYTHYMSKCISGLNRQSIHIFSRMCMKNSSLSKFFILSNGVYIRPKKLKSDDLEIFDSCSKYIKSHESISHTLLNSYIDQMNFLVNVDQCNYFSDFFNFNIEKDRQDFFFPKEVVPTKAPGSLEVLLENWSTCFKNRSTNLDRLVALKSNVIKSRIENPLGLATSVGRNYINFNLIKKTFYTQRFPSGFHLSCTGNICTADCQGCKDLKWDSDKIIIYKGRVSQLDVSCCDNICVVYVKLMNSLTGSEVFELNGDSFTRKVDKLLKAKLSNAEKCFGVSKRERDTSSKYTNSPFDSSKLQEKLQNIQKNHSIYDIDFRLTSALNLNVAPFGNTTQISLLNYITHNLYNQNESFFLACESGKCVYQCRNCKDNGKTIKLLPASRNSLSFKNANYRKDEQYSSSKKSLKNVEKKHDELSGNHPLEIKSNEFLGYLSNGFYKPSTFKTNVNYGMRFNLYFKNFHDNLGNSTLNSFRSRGVEVLHRNKTNNLLRLSHFRPTHYSHFEKSNSLPSWGFYINYQIPQFNFRVYRSASTQIITSTPSNKTIPSVNTNGTNANVTVENNKYKMKKNLITGFIQIKQANSTSGNNTKINLTTGNDTKINVTKGYQTKKNETKGNHTKNNTIKRNHTKINGTKANHTKKNETTVNHTKKNATIVNQTKKNGIKGNQTKKNGTKGNHTKKNGTKGNHTKINGSKVNNNNLRPRSLYVRKRSNKDLVVDSNPLDWAPSVGPPLDVKTYMSAINMKLSSIKIYVECCKLFCVTFIDTIDDGIQAFQGRKRIFVDFNLRNYFAIESNGLSHEKKSCLVNSILSNSSDSWNWLNKCKIDSHLRTFPLKTSCRNKLNEQCSSQGFLELFQRFEKGGQCSDSLLCNGVDKNSSEELRLRCGSQLSSHFMIENSGIFYPTIVNPCKKQAPSRITGFIQTHFMKKITQTKSNSTNTTTNTTNKTSDTNSNNTQSNNSSYVDESSLTPQEKRDLSKVTTDINSVSNLTVSIDNNTNHAPNENVVKDLKQISGVSPPKMANGNSSNSNGFFIKLGRLFILLILFSI